MRVVYAFLMVCLFCVGAAYATPALTPEERAEVIATIARLKEPDASKYVIGKHGTIYAAEKPPWAIVSLPGAVHLRECYSYHTITLENASLLLGATVVGELGNDEHPKVAARYAMQCMEAKARGGPHVFVHEWGPTIFTSIALLLLL